MNVFIYGTLKIDCCNHHVLRNIIGEIQRPIQVTTVNKYPLYKSEHYFPYLEDQPGIGKNIIGQLVEIDDDDLDKLDQFEGVPSLYKRGTIMVQTGNIKIECLCYFKAIETDVSDKNFLSSWYEEKMDWRH
jgi:gamma-glutamylcyclotransferase (GGCT)/AIG2-like uncharacterized protein YtfP